MCFAVWTIFSIVGLALTVELELSETQFGPLVGTPILTGALSRMVLGLWADRFGGRRLFAAVMALASAATFLVAYVETYLGLLAAALGVGLAGGAFSVGVAYVSKFYPPERQGTVLGVFGAGNVGAALTTLLAPPIMVAMGWQAVAQIWAVALLVMAALFLLLTEEDPETQARRSGLRKQATIASQLSVLRNLQVWRFSLYYAFVFGAFVALALWLPRYLIGVYDLDVTTRRSSPRFGG